MSTLTNVQSNINIAAFEFVSGALQTTFGGNLNRSYQNTYSGTTLAKLYFATRSAAGAVDTVNLASGLTDVFNTNLAYNTLNYVMIANNDTSGNPLICFGGTLPVMSGGSVFSLPAQSRLAFECNYAIASGYLNINVNPGAKTISYDIVAIGT